MKRLLACTMLVLGLVGAITTPAAADPPSAAEFTVPVTCDGATYELGFIPGRGEFTPALVATGNEVLVPFAFNITFTNVTTGETETFVAVKGSGTNPNAVTCTIDVTETDPVTGEQFRIQGSVTALITPVG